MTSEREEVEAATSGRSLGKQKGSRMANKLGNSKRKEMVKKGGKTEEKQGREEEGNKV